MSSSLTRLALAPLRLRAASVLAARAPSRQRRHHSYSCAPPQLNPTVFDKYMKLNPGPTVMATYVWIDGTGEVCCNVVGEEGRGGCEITSMATEIITMTMRKENEDYSNEY